MSNHTPGPWHVGRLKDRHRIYAINQRLPVCTLSNAIDETQIADANLIAAAPGLLEALKRSVSALISNGAPNCEAVKEAKIAIAKAEGHDT